MSIPGPVYTPTQQDNICRDDRNNRLNVFDSLGVQ